MGVNGIGGMFWRAGNPSTMRQWYADMLGVVDPPDGVWRQDAGPTVLAAFDRDSGYFPLDQQFMVNFRVAELTALLERLRANGVEIVGEQHEDGIGDFAWIVDPEGIRIELWEPAPGD
jgi:predicted enzyme related to lactoylglutathione lyase